MKFIMMFLVLTLVVLMAEPGEGFIGHLIHGVLRVGKLIHGLVHRHGKMDQQELDKRSIVFVPDQPPVQ
ncbi:pleurocidin-like peptide WF3 [Labrus bergylta]|uniref:pleurocidin-like peptide WF3 n=1 Tax=Labrus bergylta TaxID=56723 RepID=UPI0009B49315|nr:pleurocidin-like peptide WF3 [Labrus bergylta]